MAGKVVLPPLSEIEKKTEFLEKDLMEIKKPIFLMVQKM